MAKSEDNVVDIFTDGACSGNPGPGGWGAILHWRGHEKELFGGEPLPGYSVMKVSTGWPGTNGSRPVPVRLPSNADCSPTGSPSRLTDSANALKLHASLDAKPSGVLANACWRVSNTRNGESSGITRPEREVSEAPSSR